MANLSKIETKQLLASDIAAQKTGSYVDLVGFIEVFAGRAMKFVLSAGAGTTAGTCGGSVRAADDTSGTNETAIVTFTTQTSAGGIEEKHAVIPSGNRYVRAVGTVQTSKDMVVSITAQGVARFTP